MNSYIKKILRQSLFELLRQFLLILINNSFRKISFKNSSVIPLSFSRNRLFGNFSGNYFRNPFHNSFGSFSVIPCTMHRHFLWKIRNSFEIVKGICKWNSIKNTIFKRITEGILKWTCFVELISRNLPQKFSKEMPEEFIDKIDVLK